MHDHGGGDEWRNTQLHEGSSVGGKNDPHPVEGIGVSALDDAVEWDLAAEKIDEYHNCGPDLFAFLSHTGRGLLDFRDH